MWVFFTALRRFVAACVGIFYGVATFYSRVCVGIFIPQSVLMSDDAPKPRLFVVVINTFRPVCIIIVPVAVFPSWKHYIYSIQYTVGSFA